MTFLVLVPVFFMAVLVLDTIILSVKEVFAEEAEEKESLKVQ